MKVLDFGCGEGHLVSVFKEMGYDAFGVDIYNAFDSEFFRLIETSPFKIPFEDNTFDLIFSTSVFEHTMNHEECLNEICRVLKPGGATLHLLPSRWYLPVEPHIYVPLANIFQSKIWLTFWALLGIRNEYQKGKTWKEVVSLNIEYCKTGIKYLSWKSYKEMAVSIFGNIKFAKKEYIKHADGGCAKLGRKVPIPGIHHIVFLFRESVILMRKH